MEKGRLGCCPSYGYRDCFSCLGEQLRRGEERGEERKGSVRLMDERGMDGKREGGREGRRRRRRRCLPII